MNLTAIISAVVGNKLKSLLETISEEFGEEVKHIINNNILEYQVEEYNRNFCTKTLLHRVQPKNLKDFYQPLFITPCSDRRHSPGFRYGSERISTDSISRLFDRKQFITLIGNAGSGKSTIVKYLFLNSIDSKFRIPIKVELRYLNDYNGSVIDFIKERIFKLNKLAIHERIIERLMSSGNFVFFLDGYDEINSHKKEKTTKEIDDLVKVYSKNYYLLTSRPYTEIDLLPLFHNFEVCELSDKDINTFIGKQIPVDEKELRDKIVEAVNSKENVSYKSFLSNPLLLSMFILTFQSYSSIPQKRSEFYSQVFDALFSVHDSMSKLAFVREKQSGLSREQIIEVLKLFSFLSYFDEKFIFNGLYIDEKFKLIKEKKKNIVFDNSKLIEDLQVAIGILNKEGVDYTFPHRSLQEYFAAIYISSLSENNKKIVYQKIINTLTDKKSYRQSSRDNFHLLLSELDDRNVIKYAIIPYFEKYANEINLEEKRSDLIIDNFLVLHNVFETFEYILKSDETVKANEHFSRKFQEYRKDEKELAGKTDRVKMEKITTAYREKLAFEEILPFLTGFVSELEIKKQKLFKYLISENNSDSEIVALI